MEINQKEAEKISAALKAGKHMGQVDGIEAADVRQFVSTVIEGYTKIDGCYQMALIAASGVPKEKANDTFEYMAQKIKKDGLLSALKELHNYSKGISE